MRAQQLNERGAIYAGLRPVTELTRGSLSPSVHVTSCSDAQRVFGPTRDADYAEAGATIVSADEIWKSSDIVMKLRPPTTTQGKIYEANCRLRVFVEA